MVGDQWPSKSPGQSCWQSGDASDDMLMNLLGPPPRPEEVLPSDSFSFLANQSVPVPQTDYLSRARYFSGWRVGTIGCLITAIVVFTFNLIISIVFLGKNGREDGVVLMFSGNCTTVKNWNRWIHLGINVVSTVLLCCSNYCMQSISAPTREDLVKAHSRKRWMHIGVPSMRNLFYIDKTRTLLWLLLFSSSVPLHILFNSVVFSSLQANEYTVMPATQAFIDGGDWDTSKLVDVDVAEADSMAVKATALRDKFNGGLPHTNKTAEECFKVYSNQYISEVGDLLLVQDEVVWHNPTHWTTEWMNATFYTWARVNYTYSTTDALPFASSPSAYPSNGWRCPSRNVTNCDTSNQAEVPDASQWAPYGGRVKYCLVEKVDENCKLQFSLIIALAVLVCNAVKLLCMVFILWRCEGKYLVTLGDAIASFLEEPDPETKGRCLHTDEIFEHEWQWMSNMGHSDPQAIDARPEEYQLHRHRWARAVQKRRWFLVFILFASAIACAVVFTRQSVLSMPSNIKLLHSGMGSITGNNLLGWNLSIVGGTILANVPQAALSYFYLLFNTIITSMLVGAEWTRFFINRKRLRVSSPVGQQRSTYWLQVPFKYSLPLTCLSGLFHWSASQSLFLVSINVFSGYPRTLHKNSNQNISTCGYSPLAIMLTTLIGSIIVLGGVGLSYHHYPAGMPLAGTCSASISAACHRPEGDVNAAFLPVQWGAVKVDQEDDDELHDEDAIGHCSFTSFEVTQPEVGKKYR